jgi:hypothetical protein
MLSLARFVRSAIIAVTLASLSVVLAPQYTEPLWDWARTIAGVVSNESLPAFGAAQHWSSIALAALVTAGIGYNLWRDRRQRVLQAEYDYRTGATHLKTKVADLQAQLQRAVAERNKWQSSYLSLFEKHTDALVASKEHEVRSEFGCLDRQALAELRKELDAVVQAKGHLDGFREAMQFALASISEPGQAPKVAVAAMPNGSSRGRPDKENCRALPFASGLRT